jgi:hypothetical protein
MMGKVCLRRVEQLQLGIALQLRPTLAEGDPAVLSIDWGHLSSVVAARQTDIPSGGRRRWWSMAPVAMARNGPMPPLAIRFHNVAGARTCR